MACRRLVGNLLSTAIKPMFFRGLTYSQTKFVRHLNNEQRLPQRHIQSENDEIQHPTIDPFAQVEETHQIFIDSIEPPPKRSFNLASYVNYNETLQQLLKIGVSLYDIENLKPDAAKRLVALNFNSDCVKYITFMTDSGLKTSNLGRFITEFPEIFDVPILELQTRLNYLKSKNFSSAQIIEALNRSSYVLSQPVKTLDYKLGEFQIEFNMPADTLRKIIAKYPQVLAHPVHQYKLINFCLQEEFGFNLRQLHSILEQQPKTIDLLRPQLARRLDLIHNQIGLSHKTITQFPKLITGPDLDIKHRFRYLRKLKRDQFNPRLPLYVLPSALYNGTDEEFCEKFAKTSLGDYKLFIKTCM